MPSISVKQLSSRWPKVTWLRLWEFFFIFVSLSNMALLVYGVFEQNEMDVHFAEYLGKILLAGLVVWGIMHRKRVTRIYVLIYALFSIISGTIIDQIAAGEIQFWQFFINGRIIDFGAIFYFAFATSVAEQLTAPVNLRLRQHTAHHTPSLFTPKLFYFWRNLIVYFALYSLLGHWIEIVYCIGVRWFTGYYDPSSHIWSNYLYPFFIYGAAMALCVLLLYPIKERIHGRLHRLIPTLLCSYVFNCVACAALELGIGLLMNQPNAQGVYPLWDYSQDSINFLGQICLKDTLAFGAAATVTVGVIYPALERLNGRFQPETFNAIALLIILITLLLTAMYFVNMPLTNTLGSLAYKI